MRLIDADKLTPDCDYEDGVFYAVSVGEIECAPTIEAVPLSVIEDIKAEIDQKQYDFMADKDYDEGIRFGLMLAYQMIDKHISGKEQETTFEQEKQILFDYVKQKMEEAKQVELSGDGYDGYSGQLVYDYGKCPTCGWDFEDGDKDWEEPYCCHCGQRLKWFEYESVIGADLNSRDDVEVCKVRKVEE